MWTLTLLKRVFRPQTYYSFLYFSVWLRRHLEPYLLFDITHLPSHHRIVVLPLSLSPNTAFSWLLVLTLPEQRLPKRTNFLASQTGPNSMIICTSSQISADPVSLILFPACPCRRMAAKEFTQVHLILSHKSLETHRVAHRLWSQGRKILALVIQNRVSEAFATAVIGDDVSILHNVTLGGTGKVSGDRHPKLGDGVLIGAGTCILGNGRRIQLSLIRFPVSPWTRLLISLSGLIMLFKGNFLVYPMSSSRASASLIEWKQNQADFIHRRHDLLS
ncbi:unnamed protein product, partial [Vitis vinifera]